MNVYVMQNKIFVHVYSVDVTNHLEKATTNKKLSIICKAISRVLNRRTMVKDLGSAITHQACWMMGRNQSLTLKSGSIQGQRLEERNDSSLAQR